LGAWYVTRRDLAVEAMRDADRFTVDDPRFTTGAVLGPSMLSLDGPEHDRHRSPFAPGFRPGVLREQFHDVLAAEVDRLIADFGTGPAELRTGLAGPLAVTTITRFLGLDGVRPDDVLEWYRSIASAITDLTVAGVVSAEDQAAIDLARERVDASMATSASTSILKSIEASGALAPTEMGSAALVIMFGAIETSEGMTANVLWHLLTTPGAWHDVRANRDLLPAAIEESLRLEPAASLVDRYTTEAVELGGVTIPQGELVTLSLLAANHDPDVFTEPERFDLARPNKNQHVTFVQGPHGCLGLHLARMETAAAVHGLLDVAADPILDQSRSTPPAGLIFRKPEQLWVSWDA
jgi:cytochrome P450